MRFRGRRSSFRIRTTVVNVPSRFQGRVPGLEKGADFFEVDTGGPVTGFNGTHDSGEFLEANPYGLVPAMTHGELTLYESQAICQYISDWQSCSVAR